MAGSPVFKYKSNSCKKQKVQRKISLENVDKNQSNHSHRFPMTESESHSSGQCLDVRNGNSGIQDVTNRNEQKKSISSSISSFVFPSKKCAKRKLNFDVDGDPDDISSLRFSDKNLSLCGFRSKTSSVADQRSLPDIRNAVQSPNKNRARFSGSYRSSVGSTISCRRKLFTEFEPFVKKPRLTSPVLCQKTKSNKNEIKLSLKKKFPGVPNSDSARSGLLLNLAFSKYNLSNSKKEEVSVDFGGHVSSCAATKTDFVHYSQIKKDDSSHRRSPVFMAIKKVKRKLNLEDQSTSISNKSIEDNQDDLNLNESNDVIPTIQFEDKEQIILESDVSCQSYNNLKLDCKNESARSNLKLKNPASSTVTDSIKEHRDSKRHETSMKIFAPFSPIITKQTSADRTIVSTGRLNIAKCKSNLFKNSKIRSTLKNKIFDLSEPNVNYDAKIVDEIDDKSPAEDENLSHRNQVCKTNEFKNIRRSGISTKENSSRNIIDSKETRLINGNQSTKIICKSKNLQQQKSLKKWINRDSFRESSSMNHHFKFGNSNSCDQKFLKSHMNRFLADCLNFAGQKNDFDNEDFCNDVTKSVESAENNIIIEKKNSDNKQSDFVIESANSQEELTKNTHNTVNNKILTVCKKNRCDKLDEQIKNTGSRIVTENVCDKIQLEQNISTIYDKEPDNKRTDFTIESIDSEKDLAGNTGSKSKTNNVINNEKNLCTERDDHKIRNFDSQNSIKNVVSDGILTEQNVLITDEKDLDNQRTEFTIENVDSQDEVLIENVDSQCEQFVIETIESQNEPIHSTLNPFETDVKLLLMESQNYSMSIALKDCILKKSPKVCKSINTDLATPPMIGKSLTSEISCVISQENASKTCADIPLTDTDIMIEQVSSSASYSCVQFVDKKEKPSLSNHEDTADLNDLLNTAKKVKKKSIPNTLTHRLDKLLNREKSDFRMWEYEMSKIDSGSISTRKPAVFCIEKMWKEYSHLILLCSYFYKENSANVLCEFNELKSFSKEISNSIVIILEQDSCPKNLSYSSVFRVYPPWKLLNFESCSPLVMLRPRKISIISADENPILYKDPTIPNTSTVLRQREICSCGNRCCECGLPDSYQFLIEPLLIPDLTSFSRKSFSYRHFDMDTFNSRLVSDVCIKHRLFAPQDVILDVQILHSYKDEFMHNFSFWYFVCLDEKKNVCCVLTESKADDILPYVDKEMMLRFTGILPWKLIPSKNVMIFLQYLNFTNIPDDVVRVMDSRSIIVFLLSDEYGNVACVN